jgi:hypothetical protein
MLELMPDEEYSPEGVNPSPEGVNLAWGELSRPGPAGILRRGHASRHGESWPGPGVPAWGVIPACWRRRLARERWPREGVRPRPVELLGQSGPAEMPAQPGGCYPSPPREGRTPAWPGEEATGPARLLLCRPSREEEHRPSRLTALLRPDK